MTGRKKTRKRTVTRRKILTAPALKPGWRIRESGGVQLLECTALARIPGLVHGFTLRSGGASLLDGTNVFNLGRTDWDNPAAVAENRQRLLAAISGRRTRLQLVTQRQFHSDIVRRFDAVPPEALRGDATITRARSLLLAVLTADCLPILLADTRQRAVAAIHAGWRGTVKRIAAKTLGRMQLEFGTRPRDVVAALGPGIARCCYEVGIEVVQAFHAQFSNARDFFEGPFDRLVSDDSPNPLQWLNMHPPGHQPPPPKAHLDLFAANRWQLEDAGVLSKNINAGEFCTACHTDLLFSHRGEHGRTGRLMGVIAIHR
jgi:hypothetical protein